MALPYASASVGDGRKVVAEATKAERLSTASAPCSWVLITAEADNTKPVVIGGSTVVAAAATRRGYPLEKGVSIKLEVDNLQDVWLDVEANGEGVTFLYAPIE